MAWRIDNQVIRGEIDNRIKGRTTGTLWFVGQDEPVTLDLEGNPWRDLAGHRLTFVNKDPQPGNLEGLSDKQTGVVGDITASRKVRVPDCPMDEFIAGYKSSRTFTFHMANCLYLEWFSTRNGRVVIESVDYTLSLDDTPSWRMTPEEEVAQREANGRAITEFMGRLADALSTAAAADDESDDQPTSEAEAEADRESRRMDRLLDRISARIEKEGLDEAEDFERIMEEEREKLRREMGEPEPEPLTPEQIAEREAWIEELNAAAEAALDEMENEDWEEPPRHPLVDCCSELGLRLHHDIRDRGWLPEDTTPEHPLNELMFGVQCAGAKLAGALTATERDETWPPDPMFAGDTLVRLKKARRHLRDALAGLDAADEQQLADPDWRGQARVEVRAILEHVSRLIRDVRNILE